jgi:hypothetical protein
MNISRNVLARSSQLMFLQGGAGTAETHIVRTIAPFLRDLEMRCVICGTMDIAVAQYPGGQPTHSTLGLRIDKDQHGGFDPILGKARLARGV